MAPQTLERRESLSDQARDEGPEDLTSGRITEVHKLTGKHTAALFT